MKSYKVHYSNKYPGGRVNMGEDYLDAYCAGGKHRVALRKDGAGQWVDRSQEFGCEDSHDLSPIPKEARAHKLYADGRIAKSEEHDDRAPKGRALAEQHGGRVPSMEELASKK